MGDKLTCCWCSVVFVFNVDVIVKINFLTPFTTIHRQMWLSEDTQPMCPHDNIKLMGTKPKAPGLLEAQTRLHLSSFLLWLLAWLSYDARATPETSEMYNFQTALQSLSMTNSNLAARSLPGCSEECALNQSVVRAWIQHVDETSLIRAPKGMLSFMNNHILFGSLSISLVLRFMFDSDRNKSQKCALAPYHVNHTCHECLEQASEP
jgi:hypothetical protein